MTDSNHMTNINIVLTGFMGTGKSTIGRKLALRLERSFVDMDELIEARQEMTVRRIFQQYGEAYFRRLEADLCRELAALDNSVIATGGGTLINPQNRLQFASRALVICLDCDPQVLWQRLATAGNRPMLDADNPQARLQTLLQQRQPAYAQIQQHIDTTDLTAELVVERIITLLNRIV